MQDVILTIVKFLIPTILQALRTILTNEQFVKYGDMLLDIAEKAIQKEPDWYDEHLMDIIAVIRQAANIPDLPDE